MTRREREGFIWIVLAAAGFSVMPTLVKLTYLHSTFEPIMSLVASMLILGEMIFALQLRPRNRIDLSIAHEAG